MDSRRVAVGLCGRSGRILDTRSDGQASQVGTSISRIPQKRVVAVGSGIRITSLCHADGGVDVDETVIVVTTSVILIRSAIHRIASEQHAEHARGARGACYAASRRGAETVTPSSITRDTVHGPVPVIRGVGGRASSATS